jgi:uncharacterized integral membrane protein
LNRNSIVALILIALLILLFIFNRGTVDVHLLVGEVKTLKALVFLAFSAVGVAIGLLLK